MIYVSTSCLKNPKSVVKVLKEFEKAEIRNIELGSVHSNFDVKELMNFDCNFLIHNYFPPPKNSFNFNLSSQNISIRRKSIELAKTAIDLCCKIKSPLYSFHAGFTVDPSKLGKPFPRDNVINKERAVATFIDSVRNISEYALARGIKIAIEPNVVQKFNLIEGKNKLLLFADDVEIGLFFRFFKKSEVGLLLDLGHAAVSSHWLNFDKDEFVRMFSDKVLAVHISNNNGFQDQHLSLNSRCWQVSKLKMFKHVPIVLETMNLTTSEIIRNVKIAENSINN